VGGVSRLGEADRMRRSQGGLDTVTASGTMERQEDGYLLHQSTQRVGSAGLRNQCVRPGVRRARRRTAAPLDLGMA